MSNNRTGFRLLDYSDPADAALVLERLGGESLLREEYPGLYAAFLRTKEAHTQKRQEDGAEEEDAMTAGAYTEDLYFQSADPVKRGNDDTGVISGSLYGKTWAQANGTWTNAVICGETRDETENVALDVYSQLFQGSYYERTMKHTFVEQKFLRDKQISNHIEFHAVRPDGMMESGESSSSLYLLHGDSAMVLYLSVEHPKSHNGNNPIIMLYDRPADAGESVDYDYKDNKKLPDPSHAVNTLMPVKVQITFNSQLQPLEFDKELSTSPPTLLYKGEGVVRYFNLQKHESDYEERLNTLAKSFSVSENDPQVAIMDFGPDWKKLLDISKYTTENKGTIYLNFGFRVKCNLNGVKTSIPVLVKSVDAKEMEGKEYYQSWDSNEVAVPPIKIKWGCFARDTMFRMADGSLRRGDSIHPQDRMMSADGRPVQVLDVYRGDEDYLYILCTQSGKKLRLSKGHPVVTASGIRRVEHLRPGDQVLDEDGRLDAVRYLYEAEYGDEICNFEFIDRPDGEVVLANGIQAGDFNLQNRSLDVPKSEPPVSQEAKDAAADLERLMLGRNKG